MKALVKVAFTDKENMSDVYMVGDVFEGSEERINELVNSGHVEVMAEEPKAEEPKAEEPMAETPKRRSRKAETRES